MENIILNTLLDLFFPVSCRCCRRPKNKTSNPLGVLCLECRLKISLNDWVFCPLCNKKLTRQNPGQAEKPCPEHRSGLKWLGVASDYDNLILKPLIWEYKYGFNENLTAIFSEIMFDYLEKIADQVCLDQDNLILSFIPLAPKKLRWRGFNQSELLARNLARKTGFTTVDSLKRKAYLSPQMSLETKKERFQNIKNSFEAKNQKEIRGKNIVLIDDVCATGATLVEAAKTLKRAGAGNVYGLVLARKL